MSLFRLIKKDTKKGENTDRWLTTYSDMITLLLVFFVLLYSMSLVDLEKFRKISYGLSLVFGTGFTEFIDEDAEAFGGKVNGVSDPVIVFDRFVPPVIKDIEKIGESFFREKPDQIKDYELEDNKKFVSDEETELLGIARNLKQKIAEAKLEDKVTISMEGGILIIRIKTEGVLFDSGSADLKENVVPILDIIGDSLRFYRGLIMVEGHTDNVPINTLKYPSNWELSTARAVSVLKYWVEKNVILPTDIVAAGYADTRPVDTNETPEGRAKNRRVEILVLGRDKAKVFGR